MCLFIDESHHVQYENSVEYINTCILDGEKATSLLD